MMCGCARGRSVPDQRGRGCALKCVVADVKVWDVLLMWMGMWMLMYGCGWKRTWKSTLGCGVEVKVCAQVRVRANATTKEKRPAHMWS